MLARNKIVDMGPKAAAASKEKTGKGGADETVFDFGPSVKKVTKAKPSTTNDESFGTGNSKYTTDKMGNTVLKSKLAEDTALEAMRAAAKARRAEKEAAAAAGTAPSESGDPEPLPVAAESSSADAIRQKVAAGQKLTHKEKKVLAGLEKATAEADARTAEVTSGLQSFSLSMQGQRGDSGKWMNRTSVNYIPFMLRYIGMAQVDCDSSLFPQRRRRVLAPAAAAWT